MQHWILDENGEPKRAALMEWARWVETPARQVALDDLEGVQVSTIFPGIDYNFSGQGEPLLWETLVFGGSHDGHQVRATSRREAITNHRDAVAMVQGYVGRVPHPDEVIASEPADTDPPLEVAHRLPDATLESIVIAFSGDNMKAISWPSVGAIAQELKEARAVLRRIATADYPAGDEYDGNSREDDMQADARRVLGDLLPEVTPGTPERFLCRCGHYSNEHAATSDHEPERPSGDWYVKMDR